MGVRNRVWDFWKAFPQSVVALFCLGLIVSGITMMLTPSGYRSFRVTLIDGYTFTPAWAGLLSALSGVWCLAARAHGLGLALVVASFMGRAGLLFTAWAWPRDIPPPATRWIWEVLIAVTVIMCTSHIKRPSQ